MYAYYKKKNWNALLRIKYALGISEYLCIFMQMSVWKQSRNIMEKYSKVVD